MTSPVGRPPMVGMNQVPGSSALVNTPANLGNNAGATALQIPGTQNMVYLPQTNGMPARSLTGRWTPVTTPGGANTVGPRVLTPR